jgi:hypothetical protein
VFCLSFELHVLPCMDHTILSYNPHQRVLLLFSRTEARQDIMINELAKKREQDSCEDHRRSWRERGLVRVILCLHVVGYY